MAAAAPDLYDTKAVAIRVMKMIGIVDPYGLLNKSPPQPQQDPKSQAQMAELQLKAKDQQAKLQAQQQESQAEMQAAAQQESARQDAMRTKSADRAADRASRERVAETREETERVKLIGELAQQGHVPPEVAVAAATGKPISQVSGLVNHPAAPRGSLQFGGA